MRLLVLIGKGLDYSVSVRFPVGFLGDSGDGAVVGKWSKVSVLNVVCVA